MGKHLCMLGTEAFFCPECFPVMLHGETAEKEVHPRSATPLVRSEDKGTDVSGLHRAWLLTGERQAFC